jgi:phosphoadenosine phosphosulfate reductase
MHVSLDAHRLSEAFEDATPVDILKWTWRTFGDRAAATSSFQSQSVPLLHMIATEVPGMPVLFLDTGFHFPETLAFRDRLARDLGLNLRVLRTELGHRGFRKRYGQLHRHNPDLCCRLNKVRPLHAAMRDYDAWVTGIRRDQTPQRRTAPIVTPPDDVPYESTYKVCPLATWTSRDVWTYVNEHDLPSHPLLRDGYFSIGCAPCTRRVEDGEAPRAGRWAGRQKTECGLHGGTPPDRPSSSSDPNA